jgi:hypothetical protein
MDISKYISFKYSNGEIISKFIIDFINLYDCKNILFVRTPTTGAWLDNIFVNDTRVTRILYDTHTKKYKYHKTTKIIEPNVFEYTLDSLNKKFDLICMDPFHEYTHSKRDFNLLYSYLSDIGTLISHDCFPMTKELANPSYKSGNWCGETYIAFVEFAYNNPTLYYGLLIIDTGIGIISKLHIDFLKNNLNMEKQEFFLSLYKNNSNDRYKYFCENSQELVNSVNL